MVALRSSRAQASPRVTAAFAPVALCRGSTVGPWMWRVPSGRPIRTPRPRSSVRRRQAAALAHGSPAPNHRKARKCEPGAGPGLSACPVPASLPYRDPLQRKGSARRAIRGIGSDNLKMISARPCRLWRALIGALTSTEASAWITEIKRALQRISRDRTRALLVLPCETQITNDFENRSSKPRRNDYVPVSGVNAESRRLTAGGCCLTKEWTLTAARQPASAMRWPAGPRAAAAPSWRWRGPGACLARSAAATPARWRDVILGGPGVARTDPAAVAGSGPGRGVTCSVVGVRAAFVRRR